MLWKPYVPFFSVYQIKGYPFEVELKASPTLTGAML
jgi:hypothetical protein